MKIISDRITIRDLSFKDDYDYLEYASDNDVGPNAGWKPVDSIDLARKIIAGHILSKETFAIVFNENNKMIGTISIYNSAIRKYNKAKSLGFSLNHSYWEMGIMTEAVKLIIEYVFTKTDCEVFEVGHHSDNLKSKSVIEKCGFHYDGRLCMFKKLYNGNLVDADFYSMTKEEYERMIK